MAVREIVADGFRVQLDLGSQVLELSLPEEKGWAEGPELGAQEAPLAPTLSGLTRGDFASASMLAQKAKQFDDGLYAAADLAAQHGAGTLGGKSALLASLARHLTEPCAGPLEGAAVLVVAAARLGDPRLGLPAELEPEVQAEIDAFLQDELRSKPIGLYTWSDGLTRVFRQDRLLQTELRGEAGIQQVVRALHADPRARATYEGCLALVSRLTNPLVDPDLRGLLAALDRGAPAVPPGGLCFFPPSRAHETDLVKRLYGTTPVPHGFSLVEEMIRRIRSGALSLTPTADSGWYDYQTWSLEPLVVPEKMPEAPRLKFDDTYLDQLLELFKGILALTRETHVKQLEIPLSMAEPPSDEPRPILDIYPELSAEPLATYYLRRARSYRFVREVLEGAFGPKAPGTLRRQTAGGPAAESLADELGAIESIFRGAHALVCRQLGLSPSAFPEAGPGGEPDADSAGFQEWLAEVEEDPDLGQDSRMMVPLFYDVVRKKTKVCVFLGWTARPLRIAFAQSPKATVLDARGREVPDDRGPILCFHATSRALAYPATAEVYVEQILDRDEFRTLCDRHQTRSAILANLT